MGQMERAEGHAHQRGGFTPAAVAGVCLLLGACAQIGAGPAQMASTQALNDAPKPAASADLRTELQKATEYWGKEYAKNPRDAQTALNYARNLKALGEKQQALGVLQQSSVFNPTHRGVNGEYGRLALELEQVSVAQKLLEQADDPANPDWRIISARGTVLAKQGKYRDAIPLYERALTLAPNQASVLNNLALAHAMVGDADQAEPLLKRAVAAGGHEARISQNLAIVLGLQGKYDEAKLSAARDLPADKAAANVDYVRHIVKLEPKPMATGSLGERQPTPAAAPAKSDSASVQKPAKVAKAATQRPAITEDSAQVKKTTKAAAKPTDSAQGEAGDSVTKPIMPQGATAKGFAAPALKGAAADDRAEGATGSWSAQVATAKKGSQ